MFAYIGVILAVMPMIAPMIGSSILALVYELAKSDFVIY
jgi:hypothetical protein